tara:strand:+ start:405 stop:1736 length:1332 start_codon:yes stop_codon:yes gene_type:complete
MKSTIKLINHASVKVTLDNVSIISDPWYEGSVFHKGWKLLHELPEEDIKKHLSNTDYIYVSHEHPDHFSPSFFFNKEYKSIIEKYKTKILFQETKDKRVLNFLIKNGFDVIEVPNNKFVTLKNNVKVKIIKFGYIDSAIIIQGSKEKVLNLNDCPLNEINEIKKFRKDHGKFDLLLTQFSYAAWKGNKDNKDYRKTAASDKLDTLINQFKILECKKAIPFASFIYFSNELNKFMNDEINKPHIFQKYLKTKIESIILAPGEEQYIEELKQNDNSIEFWKKKYENVNNLPIERFEKSIDYESLKNEYSIYKKKILEINSKFLIYISSKLKFLKFFQPINIFLLDHNKNYEFSLLNGFKQSKEKNPDISMHSESLYFIFKNDFGYDTLTVNGCFKASKEGFLKSTRSFAIGSLNSMGLKLNLGLLFNYNLIFFFLKLLKKVSKKL